MVFKKLSIAGFIVVVLYANVSRAQNNPDLILPVRGFAIAAPSPSYVDSFVLFIENELAPRKVNVLILRVDYNYQYKTHPELRDSIALSESDIKKIVSSCRVHAIRIIPQINLLGHQSWANHTGRLLSAYPAFDETPEVQIPEKYQWPNSDNLYCKSYCPLHPDVHKVVFDVVDELCNVFEATAFHAGMDEVFYIGSDKCPRCKGQNKAKLLADEVTRVRDHLAASNRELWIWGDRLIDGAATGIGMWEGSMNETFPAIGMIPKDVMICDWHYERADKTAPYFAMNGFNVATCPWRSPSLAVQQLNDMISFRQNATNNMKLRFRGIIQTVWSRPQVFIDGFYQHTTDPQTGDNTPWNCFRQLFDAIDAIPAQKTTSGYKEDFNFFWSQLNDEYCYFNKKQTNWQKVKEIYEPLVDRVTTREQFIAVMEKVLYEIYDHHAILNTNIGTSQRLVPSGTDMWAEYVNGKPVITEIRPGFGASSFGITAGMEIVAINDQPVDNAVNAFLPKSLKGDDIEARNFTLRLLLAGNHVQPRKLSLQYKGSTNDYYPDKNGFAMDKLKYPSMAESKKIGTVGYIKINDCLYNDALIRVFDSIMATMDKTTGLILDLRETPGGGNTQVARAILGWFTNKEKFYQKHEYFFEEKSNGIKRSWEEIVSPRNDKYYGKPLVILCDHWTGSIAEGITVGFDALNRPQTAIIGTALAGLNGAVYSYEMPFSKIHFSFPAERLYHINGLAREKYLPKILVDVTKPSSFPDPFIDRALAYFKTLH